MSEVDIRKMEPADRSEVADLIAVSTNTWYQTRGLPCVFPDGHVVTGVFFDVYEKLDAGYGIVAVSKATGRLAGSCFYHPRPTHVSLGIMNVHPNYFGQGVARSLLDHIVGIAESQQKPLRLISSAMNLDSFSLYTRAGFVPRQTFQDMYITVPEQGLDHQPAGAEHVRAATLDDIEAMAALEMEVAGIRRDKDYRYFIENQDGFWHASVYQQDDGPIDGFMVSVGPDGLCAVGPGVARTTDQALALLIAELNYRKGRTPLFIVPVDCEEIVGPMYDLGAKNCEFHFSQVRGEYQRPTGVILPTFLPESG